MKSISASIESSSRMYPRRIAYSSDGAILTYRELAEAVASLAIQLRKLGVQLGSRVIVFAPNDPDWLTVTAAIDCCGGVAVPVHTWSTPRELTDVVLRVQPCLILHPEAGVIRSLAETVRGAADHLMDGGIRDVRSPQQLSKGLVIPHPRAGTEGGRRWSGLALSSLARGLDGPDETRRVAIDNSALWRSLCEASGRSVFFTSGTTGAPTGVVIDHEVAFRRANGMAKRMGFPSGAPALLPLPLFWSYGGINALHTVLGKSGSLVTASRFDPEEALSTLQLHECQFGYFIPQVLRELGNSAKGRKASAFGELTGGVTIGSPRDLAYAIDELGITSITNIYGGTETYGHVTATSPTDERDIVLYTQGHPLPGVHVAIDSAALGPNSSVGSPVSEIAEGDIGEVVVRGDVATDFISASGRLEVGLQNLIRTGDLAKWQDGRLVFQSRTKNMLRVNNINVSPAEIERVIMEHPKTERCVVVGLPSEREGEVPGALVELRPDWEARGEAVTHEVLELCAVQLAPFKVPRVVVVVSQLPETELGKLEIGKIRDLLLANFREPNES